MKRKLLYAALIAACTFAFCACKNQAGTTAPDASTDMTTETTENTTYATGDLETTVEEETTTLGNVSYNVITDITGIWKRDFDYSFLEKRDWGEEWVNCQVSAYYVFDRDGKTVNYVYATDGRDEDNKYISPEDEFKRWKEGSAFKSKHSYAKKGTFEYSDDEITFEFDGEENITSVEVKKDLYIEFSKDPMDRQIRKYDKY